SAEREPHRIRCWICIVDWFAGIQRPPVQAATVVLGSAQVHGSQAGRAYGEGVLQPTVVPCRRLLIERDAKLSCAGCTAVPPAKPFGRESGRSCALVRGESESCCLVIGGRRIRQPTETGRDLGAIADPRADQRAEPTCHPLVVGFSEYVALDPWTRCYACRGKQPRQPNSACCAQLRVLRCVGR